MPVFHLPDLKFLFFMHGFGETFGGADMFDVGESWDDPSV